MTLQQELTKQIDAFEGGKTEFFRLLNHCKNLANTADKKHFSLFIDYYKSLFVKVQDVVAHTLELWDGMLLVQSVLIRYSQQLGCASLVKAVELIDYKKEWCKGMRKLGS